MRPQIFTWLLLSLLLAAFAGQLSAQRYQAVLPGMEGEELRRRLARDYKPRFVQDYRTARELMYRDIDNEQDSVRCVYTGYALYLPPDADNPVSSLLKFGSFNGIITEHTYPRSKGARSGNAKSDMHHLFPARLGANIARLNYPFGEIDDEQAEAWFIRTKKYRDQPFEHADQYSEKADGVFEPREDHKGNVARAIFYFFTMYRGEAMAADPEFFELQRETLCKWHFEDPVDEREWERTMKIAKYQDNKPNPFVLDCTLAARIYCPGSLTNCGPTASVKGRSLSAYPETAAPPPLQLKPNPVNALSNFYLTIRDPAEVYLALYDRYGKELLTIVHQQLAAGEYVYPFPISLLREQREPGMICRLKLFSKGEMVVFDEEVRFR